ncbi:MAG TPA: hypothetical protein VM884_07695, partial [Flavisolibacter sp.]|nr:hypothetical protein [Flavisolibacter sp.]
MKIAYPMNKSVLTCLAAFVLFGCTTSRNNIGNNSGKYEQEVNEADGNKVFHGLPAETNAPLKPKAKAIKIILDSDLGQDCDDASVMALMHKFADNGEVEILATMFPMRDTMGAPAMDVINTYYGRPNIPIGTYKGNYEYLGKLWDHYNTKLATGFPHDLK